MRRKTLVKPWDQTIASRLIVRYNHLGSWLILNVYKNMSTHIKCWYCTWPEVLSYPTVYRASCYKETHQVFSYRRVCCCESLPLHRVYMQSMGPNSPVTAVQLQASNCSMFVTTAVTERFCPPCIVFFGLCGIEFKHCSYSSWSRCN